MIYLACPYTADNPDLMHRRRGLANHLEVQLIGHDLAVYNPLRAGPDLARHCAAYSIDFDIYEYDLRFLAVSSALCVYRIDGWKESKGVQLEIAYAKRHGIPIVYADPFVKGDEPAWLVDLMALDPD